MPPDTPIPQASQEQSIKERKRELFAEEPVLVEHRESFETYLKTTPPAPMSGLARGILWAVGVLVVLLLIAALAADKSPRAGRPARAKKAASSPGPAPRPAIALGATGPGGAREPVPATPERTWGAAGTGSEV